MVLGCLIMSYITPKDCIFYSIRILIIYAYNGNRPNATEIAIVNRIMTIKTIIPTAIGINFSQKGGYLRRFEGGFLLFFIIYK